MRVLVDTNILHRSAQPNHPLCTKATQAVSKLIRQKDAVFFCSQNIADFWNVATRPADQNGLGLTHEEALQEVASIEKLLTLLPDIPAIYAAWKERASSHSTPLISSATATSPRFNHPQFSPSFVSVRSSPPPRPAPQFQSQSYTWQRARTRPSAPNP